MSNVLDIEFWQAMGLTGVLFAVIVGIVIFSIAKGKMGGVTIGPSEAGMREFCGITLWKLGPGLHPDIDGLWKVRKVSIAEKLIDIKGDVEVIEKMVMDFEIGVTVQVQNTKKALKARIYRAEDNDKSNMENSEAERQVTKTLKRSARRLLEKGSTADEIESRLRSASRSKVAKYGYKIKDVEVTRLVPRPLSEVAQAIKESGPNNPGVGPNAVPGLVPDLVAFDGESA